MTLTTLGFKKPIGGDGFTVEDANQNAQLTDDLLSASLRPQPAVPTGVALLVKLEADAYLDGQEIKFYLAADLSGGDITLEIQKADLTSILGPLNLKDYEAANVAELTKGYHTCYYDQTAPAFQFAPSGGALEIEGQDIISGVLTESFIKHDRVTIDEVLLSIIKSADPDITPANLGYSVSFSPNGDYLALGHAGDYNFSIFKIEGDVFTKLADPAVKPGSACNGVAFSPDSNYLATTGGSPLIVYKRVGDVFTALSIASLPVGTGYSIAFSRDGLYLSVGSGGTSYLTIYKRNGDVFTKLATPASLPPNNTQGVDHSPGGRLLAAAHASSPYIHMYERTGDVFTYLPGVAQALPSTGNGAAFSPDGNFFAAAHNNSPYVTIFNVAGKELTKLANPGVLPTGSGESVAWSRDSKYLAVAHATSPYLSVYERDDEVFTKLANPTTLVPGIGNGVAFSFDNEHLVVANNGAPYIIIYKLAHRNDIYKATELYSLINKSGFGYITADGILNDTVDVVRLLK